MQSRAVALQKVAWAWAGSLKPGTGTVRGKYTVAWGEIFATQSLMGGPAAAAIPNAHIRTHRSTGCCARYGCGRLTARRHFASCLHASSCQGCHHVYVYVVCMSNRCLYVMRRARAVAVAAAGGRNAWWWRWLCRKKEKRPHAMPWQLDTGAAGVTRLMSTCDSTLDAIAARESE